jgi:hypothetical protein
MSSRKRNAAAWPAVDASPGPGNIRDVSMSGTTEIPGIDKILSPALERELGRQARHSLSNQFVATTEEGGKGMTTN